MGSKINEISRRLDDISTRQAKLGLKLELGVGQCGETFASGGRASPWQRPPTTSLINEPVQGRDKDKKDIIDLLLKDEAGEDNFRVLPIVGIGGTGKTTLAQLICQDEAVMKLFDPIAWVCISEERDVAKISKAVLHAVSPNQNIDLMDFNIVQHSLGEILTQKRFLLVLDDVWNINSYEQWNSLQIPLNCGEKGSKIIITTRNANVARSMGAYDRCYNLRPLSNDDCWSVFVRHACECLIHQSEGDELQMEDLGANYFDEMLSRSFFQPSSNNKSNFIMHGLIHDLARDIAKEICFSLKKDEMKNNKLHIISGRTRHASFIRSEKDVLKSFQVLNRTEHLRTFVALPININDQKFYLTTKVFHDLLQKLRHLRVLSLSGYEITELPDWIGDLKLLRYLNLSHTAIKWLPESASCLYNLQALILCNCINLTKLPVNIGNVINLRHLDISGSIQLKEMPSRLGDLINLQTLSKFIVGKHKRSGINELKSLLNLRGKLFISGLHNIVNIRDVKEVNLKGRHNIEELTMEWSSDFEDSRNETNELAVFKLLQPHESLKKLVVVCYGGLTFPNWLGDHSFTKIEHLSLKSCKKLTRLPPLGRLPLLKELHIEGMDEITCIGDELRIENCSKLQPSIGSSNTGGLKVLSIWGCSSLKSIPRGEFPPTLETLSFWKCEQLESIPGKMLQNLTSLHLLNIYVISFSDDETQLFLPTSLQDLHIINFQNLKSIASMGLQSLVSLETLVLENCPKLESVVPNEGLPPTLAGLQIKDCPILKQRCIKDKGKDWLKIAQIPKVVIDEITQQ
ncbi:unnamed protein product, partial [Vitis vinifera]